MKKRELLLLLLALTTIYQLSLVYSQSGVGVELKIVDTSGPIINLITPANNSGNSNGNITFFYNASDANTVDNCSLIINNKINITGTSITEDSQINFKLNNTAAGTYNWSINCTDNLSYVDSSPERTFSVVLMKNFNGSTTNISSIDIRNITNFTIELKAHGKINFSEDVDLSLGFDLDKYVNISFNSIELDSTALTVLNKSATLYLYNLIFDDPRVLRDGDVCPSTICTEVSYTGGTFKTFIFNVTQFTVYSSENTPGEPEEPGPGGAGAGAGGGGMITKTDFTTDKETLKVILKQGQTKEETLNIKNTGTTTLDLTTYLQPLRKFIFSPSLDEIKTTLKPNEEQTLNFVFGAEKGQKPDVYTGEIIIKSRTLEKIINTILEIESAKPLFDVDVEVLPQYKSIVPGNEIFIEVSLFNVRGFGRVDVNLEYSIKDFKGNLIAKEEETVAVETQAKFTRELLVPTDIKPGTYVASVKVTFEDSVGLSSDIFEIKAKAIRLYPITIKDYTFYLLLGGIFIVCIFLVYGFYSSKKEYKPKTKEEEVKLIKTEGKIQKLEKELNALEKAYKSKFISEESYQKGKERIEKDLKKLGK